MSLNQLRVWMRAATRAEKVLLADEVGLSLGTLNQMAGGYRYGGDAHIASGTAIRIEKAAEKLRAINKNLPPIVRTDLSPACRDCEFAQRCLGAAAVASQFEVITLEKNDE